MQHLVAFQTEANVVLFHQNALINHFFGFTGIIFPLIYAMFFLLIYWSVWPLSLLLGSMLKKTLRSNANYMVVASKPPLAKITAMVSTWAIVLTSIDYYRLDLKSWHEYNGSWLKRLYKRGS